MTAASMLQLHAPSSLQTAQVHPGQLLVARPLLGGDVGLLFVRRDMPR